MLVSCPTLYILVCKIVVSIIPKVKHSADLVNILLDPMENQFQTPMSNAVYIDGHNWKSTLCNVSYYHAQDPAICEEEPKRRHPESVNKRAITQEFKLEALL